MKNRITLLQGDCLDQMKSIESGTVDVVVTDPPYVLKLKSAWGNKKHRLNPWADMVNPAYWYTAWLRECYRILKDDGALWSFLNWRSIVTFTKAACDAEWPIESLLVWDKQSLGTGTRKGLRQSYEMVALFIKGNYTIPNRGLPDIWRYKTGTNKPHGHPAEKPEGFIKMILEASPGSIVLDPFMGSGTTGVVCVDLGKEFIGIEMDTHFYHVAKDRIDTALAV